MAFIVLQMARKQMECRIDWFKPPKFMGSREGRKVFRKERLEERMEGKECS